MKLDSWIKPEFPKLFAVASEVIATPLLFIFALVSVQHAIDQPASSSLATGLSTFGVTAALSGVSFSMARTSTDSSTAYFAGYAGEKFLHSAILLIQCLVVLYIRDTIVEIDWVKGWPSLITTAKAVAHVLLFMLTAAGLWTWHHGYSKLNEILWRNWEQRIHNINSSPKDNESK